MSSEKKSTRRWLLEAVNPWPTYQPLEAGQIRIIGLRPNVWNNRTEAHVDVVDLTDKDRDWTAVSYTWGSEDRDRFIYWVARKVRITKSCLQVCQQIMDDTRFYQSNMYWVWIDQISINQSDVVGKSCFLVDLLSPIARVVLSQRRA